MEQSNKIYVSTISSLSQNELIRLYKELKDESCTNAEILKCINFLIKRSCKG